MSTFVPLDVAECAVCVPLGSIEWHAPEAIREEGRPPGRQYGGHDGSPLSPG